MLNFCGFQNVPRRYSVRRDKNRQRLQRINKRCAPERECLQGRQHAIAEQERLLELPRAGLVVRRKPVKFFFFLLLQSGLTAGSYMHTLPLLLPRFLYPPTRKS